MSWFIITCWIKQNEELSAMKNDVIKKHPGGIWFLLGGILIFCFFLSLIIGSVHIPFKDILHIFMGESVENEAWSIILLDYRLPKSLTAMLAGCALAVSGLQMQTLFRNPLADPYILGISSGASLGAAVAILLLGGTGVSFLANLGLAGDMGVILASSLGALLVFLLVSVMARRVHTVTLLVLGVLVGYIANAVVRVMVYFSLPESVQAYLGWTNGSFSAVSWPQLLPFTLAILTGWFLAVRSIKPLNAFLLGETYARSMGVDPRKARRWIVLSASLLAGAVTAFCGVIGFIGIAVPHLCRSLLKSGDHRVLLPACSILGASVALIADILAQFPGNQAILPLNSVTALIGAPFIIMVILKQRNLRRTFNA